MSKSAMAGMIFSSTCTSDTFLRSSSVLYPMRQQSSSGNEVRSAAANLSLLSMSLSALSTSCVTLPSLHPLMIRSMLVMIMACTNDGLLCFKLSTQGRAADSAYVHGAPTLHCSVLAAVPYPQGCHMWMPDWVPARLLTCALLEHAAPRQARADAPCLPGAT